MNYIETWQHLMYSHTHLFMLSVLTAYVAAFQIRQG